MGRIQSEETKKKISNSLKGVKKNSHFSKNARLKLAEAILQQALKIGKLFKHLKKLVFQMLVSSQKVKYEN